MICVRREAQLQGQYGFTAAFITSLAVLLFATPARAQWTQEDEIKLRGGEAVSAFVEQDGRGQRLRAAINIPAPIEVVWEVMRACDSAPEFTPNLLACRILEADQDGRYDVRENTTRGFGPMPGALVRFRSAYITDSGAHEIRVRHLSGGVSDMQGVWRFEPLESGRVTRLHYDFHVVTGLPIPSFIERAIFRSQSLGNLRAIRDEAQRRSDERRSPAQ